MVIDGDLIKQVKVTIIIVGEVTVRLQNYIILFIVHAYCYLIV